MNDTPASSRPRTLARTKLLVGGACAAALVTIAAAVLPGIASAEVGSGGTARPLANCNGYVALTFDDGPNPANTNNLLNALKQAGARATLFNIGQNAASNPALVRAEVAAGHWIGNHSFSHGHMGGMGQQQAADDLSRTQNAIKAGGAPAPNVFRPPYGETGAGLQSAASSLGLRLLTWDVDSKDWNGANTAQIVQAANQLQNGGVILMHDQYAATVAAIGQIVNNLKNRGLCPGMISPQTGRAVAPN